MGYGKSKYANPGDRPQLANMSKTNRKSIVTKLASDNPNLQRALGVGTSSNKKRQSSFMKKVNQPLIKNQIKEDLLDAFMQLIDQERLIEQAKINLITHSDFNLFDAFKVFDQAGRGCLTLSELYNSLVN